MSVASFSPEFRLAAACAMWPPSDHRHELIRTTAVGALDWVRFLRVCRRHGVVGLVQDGFMRAQPEIAREVAQEISAVATALLLGNLTMAAEAVRLQRLFDDAGITVLFLKGASLAARAYGDLGLRSSKDIDLLVTSAQVTLATKLLEDAGYRRFDPPQDLSDSQLQLLMQIRKDIGLIHAESGCQVELHWRLFENPLAMGDTSILAASRVVPLIKTAGLRTLGEEDLFAYLCVHGSLHSWNQLKWLADVGALLAAAGDDKVHQLYRAAETRHGARAAAQAMLLCHSILHVPLPRCLICSLGSKRMVPWLKATALSAISMGDGEKKSHDVRFGTTRGSLARFLLNPSWRYWWAELRNLSMNQSDILAVPLPDGLRFLYPVFRLPLWAARQFRKNSAK